MTNEALAELIKQGDNNELLPILWEKNAKLLYKLSNRTYRAYKDALKQHGIELDDLIQESYDVLLGAVEAYDPAKGFQLTTYFKYQFKQVVRRMLGGSDALNQPNTMSFEEPLSSEDEELKLEDTVADPTAGDGFALVEMGDYYKPLYQAIESLEPDDREIIEMRFFSNPEQLTSYTEMGERLGGIPIETVRQRIYKALSRLRYGKTGIRLKAIYGADFISHAPSGGLKSFRRNGASSVEIIALARIQSEERLKHED